MSGVFSTEGRYNRKRYIGTILATTLIGAGSAFAVGLTAGTSSGNPFVGLGFGLVVGIGTLVANALQVVKRLHDLNRPGTHYWLLLVPLYNFYLGFLLLFQKGSEGENKYGPDPLAST